MIFKDALSEAVKNDHRTHTDPFLLYSHISDIVGDDYEAKKAAEDYYILDRKYGITESLLSSFVSQKAEKKRLSFLKVLFSNDKK